MLVYGRIARLPAMNGPGAEFSLSDGWDLSGLTLADLWLRYLALGGTVSPEQLDAYVDGHPCPDSYQHNMIAQALNEHFCDLGQNHPVGYRDIPPLT